MYINTTCVTGAYRGQKEDAESPRTGVADGCKPPCGFWELNSCLLQEHVNLIMEPSP